jgi:hypothetical protein
MEYAYNKVRENLGLAQERQKHYYDQKVSGGEYTVGDIVMLYTPAVKKARSRKLYRRWTGPYRIVKVISDVVFRLQKLDGRGRTVVHYNRLKPFTGPRERSPTREPDLPEKANELVTREPPVPIPAPEHLDEGN